MFFQIFLNSLPGIIVQGLMWGIMAIGVYITFRILDIADLSVDGTVSTGGAVCVILVCSGVNVWIAMLVATIVGLLAGLVTGILHVFLGIPAILAGILTQLSLFSVNLIIMKGSNIAIPYAIDVPFSRLFADFSDTPIYKNSVVLSLLVTLVVVFFLYWFFGTEFGCSIRATGCNEKMSKAQGINTDLNKIIGLVLSNGIVALAGAMIAQLDGAADINKGRGAIVIGLASVIIGETLFGKLLKGNFALKLLQVSLGGIVYFIVYQIAIQLKFNTELLKMISAIIVAIFLGVPFLREKYFSRPKVKEDKKC
ncbi:MAG: ABC transporter permease [Clostridia bacterium]|nr:ABC transporter permease [Clostridia bacterium]